MTTWYGFTRLGTCCLLIALFSACATRKVAPTKYTFFPPAPDEPRVQFLTAFSSDRDLGTGNSFSEFVTGKPRSANALIKPYGVALSNGKVYVCDTVASSIEVFDLNKKRTSYFVPIGEGHLQTPINMAIDDDGTRYVADTGRGQVLIFGKDDSLLTALGRKDEMKPCDVAVTSDRFYVADLKGHAVRVYSKTDRKLLFSIPRDPKATEGRLFSPTNIAVDRNGRLLVSDIGGFSVVAYDLDGKYLRTIGQQGVAPGLFARPKGVAVDRSGLTYVVDAATQVVQIFDTEGRLLLFFGQPGASTQGQLSLPAGIKIDYDNAPLFQKYVAPGYRCEYVILVVSQFGPQKVNVYGFLKKQ